MKAITYHYFRFVVDSNTLERVGSQIIVKASDREGGQDGKLFGVWASQIGPSVNEGVLMTAGPDEKSSHACGEWLLANIPEIYSWNAEGLDPTSRPIDDTAPRSGGVYTHRWFAVRPRDWDEFLSLSEQSWPQWESVFGAKLYGFLKSRTRDDRGLDKVLLLCRYEDLKHWENSRWWAQDPDDAAKEALHLQRRRREITIDTKVSMMRLMGPD